MKIKLSSEQELIDTATEAIHILSNLRKFTKLWEQGYGVELRNRKKYWEKKADELIEKLKVGEQRHSRDIKIEIDAD